MNEQDIPSADAPDWGSPYNFEWFKYHHLTGLQKHTAALEKEYETNPPGKAFTQDAIVRFLDLTDQLIQLAPWLPDSAGGTGEMNKIIAARKKFQLEYLNKEGNIGSYYLAQEITDSAFTICNYMNAVCEDE